MKKLLIIASLFLFVALAAVPSFAQHEQSASPGAKSTLRVPGILYVKFKGYSGIDVLKLQTEATGHPALDAAFRALGVTEFEPFEPNPVPVRRPSKHGMDRTVVLHYSNSEMTPDDAAKLFANLPEVESYSPRFAFKPCYLPNDSLLSQQYALTLMSVPQAWDFSKGDTSIVIAICDEGVNYLHEDLQKNLSTNPGEMGLDANGKDKRTNGKDDDGDKVIDNWRGWDFGGSGSPEKPKPDNDPMPAPNQSHGTFVTGCAAASTNNIHGIAGSGFNCRYLALKCTIDTSAFILYGYEAIRYSAKHHARIINCSWGGYTDDPNYIAFFQSIIDEATDSNSLVIAASGNDHTDIDITHFDPAYLNNVLTVGASDQADAAALDFTNYGHRVDVYAPGRDIISTGFPATNEYSYSSGTSFSAPYTAGVAGLVMAKHPEWTPAVIRRFLVETCDQLSQPKDRNKYWGRVSAFKAVTTAPTFPGLIITGYTIDGVSKAPLPFLNKEYTLGVVFKNIVGNGTTLIAKLVKIDGYNVLQGTATLGAMNTAQSNTGTFKFTRDSTDDGSILPMKFYVTDGKTYKDTIELTLNISGDAIYKPVAVYDAPKVISSLSIAPNPATNVARAYFTIASGGGVRFTLSDMLGRTVSTVDAGTYDVGENRFELPIDGLASGVYIVRLESTSGEQIVSRLIVQ